MYLVGAPLEGAALVLDADGWTLYAQPPSNDDVLWAGPQPSLDDLSVELELPVRPIEELVVPGGGVVATLPAQDGDSAAWQSSLCEKTIEPGGGDDLDGPDAVLADAMISLRLRHDEAAIEQLRFAAAIAARAHRAGMAATRPRIREASVRAAMDGVLTAAGLSHAYHPIVTRRGEALHNPFHTGVLEPSDLVLADVGGETPDGWASDLTRTWPVDGTYSPTQRALYEVVLRAQMHAIEQVVPGAGFRDIHRHAGIAITEGLVGEGVLRGDPVELYDDGIAAVFFPHGIGHLVGLDVHDLEDLGDRAGYGPGRQRNDHPSERYLRLDRVLESGMVVTVEPGLYRIGHLLADPNLARRTRGAIDRARLDRFSDVRGIRIEDEVLVTSGGPDVLTADVPKEPDAVERIVRGTRATLR